MLLKSKHGKIASIREGVWGENFPCKELPDGYRYVSMVVENPIPSYVTIKGETTLVTYRGQSKTCRNCEQKVHHGMTCAQNRKQLKQSANDKFTSDATILKPNNEALKTVPLANAPTLAQNAGVESVI